MQIRTDLIRDSSGEQLARKIRGGLDAFYADPKNRKAFEEWKEKRKKSEKQVREGICD